MYKPKLGPLLCHAIDIQNNLVKNQKNMNFEYSGAIDLARFESYERKMSFCTNLEWQMGTLFPFVYYCWFVIECKRTCKIGETQRRGISINVNLLGRYS